jgi:hypothetical protein
LLDQQQLLLSLEKELGYLDLNGDLDKILWGL